MRKDIGNKPWIYPQPVLIIGTYDENGVPDLMNAAWGGVGDDHQIFLCLSPEHKTVQNMLKKKAFTVALATADQLAACDYVGIVSANDMPDKIARSGLTVVKAPHVDAPMVMELPVCLECELISYEPEHCHTFGEIVNVSVDESVLAGGVIDPKKLDPLVYSICTGEYYRLGEAAGKAFTAGQALVK